jgi:ribA/ribD-fused uncharacterized protein
MTRAKLPERQVELIDAFKDEYAFLSNFHPYSGTRRYEEAPPVVLRGRAFETAEHAYQACKTDDPASQAWIASATSPGEAKKWGYTLTLRPGWDDMKVRVMRAIIQAKFAPTTELSHRLMLTGNKKLVEGNTWGDDFWGCVQVTPGGTWVGANNLGLLLMEQRKALQGEIPYP